jgi:hypothetical protein
MNSYPIYEIHGTCIEDEPRDSDKSFTYRGMCNSWQDIYLNVIAKVYEFGYFGNNEYYWNDRVI